MPTPAFIPQQGAPISGSSSVGDQTAAGSDTSAPAASDTGTYSSPSEPAGVGVAQDQPWYVRFGNWERDIGQQIIQSSIGARTGFEGPGAPNLPSPSNIPLPGGTAGQYVSFLRIALLVGVGAVAVYFLLPTLRSARNRQLEQ